MWPRRPPGGNANPETFSPGAPLPLTGPPTIGWGPPNGYGLTDLSGSCHEWCVDWYEEGYYLASPTLNPHGPLAGTRRGPRGGAARPPRPRWTLAPPPRTRPPTPPPPSWFPGGAP